MKHIAWKIHGNNKLDLEFEIGSWCDFERYRFVDTKRIRIQNTRKELIHEELQEHLNLL